jgi:hypothetical protein
VERPDVEEGPLAAERIEVADVVEDPEVAQHFDLTRGALMLCLWQRFRESKSILMKWIAWWRWRIVRKECLTY